MRDGINYRRVVAGGLFANVGLTNLKRPCVGIGFRGDERRPPGQHVEQDATEAVDVGEVDHLPWS